MGLKDIFSGGYPDDTRKPTAEEAAAIEAASRGKSNIPDSPPMIKEFPKQEDAVIYGM